MTAGLFVTCVVDVARPQAARSAVRLLGRSGVDVDVPTSQTCCGQPAWNAGYPDEARRVARNAIRVFADHDPVIVLAGSCATMVRVFYRELFDGRPEAAAAEELAERTLELSEYLATVVVGSHDVPSSGPPQAEAGPPVVYHDSCHMMRELGIRSQPRGLLREAGYEVHEIPGAERCCGFGGTFSVKLPAVSTAMADEKLAEMQRTAAGTVVGCDASCLLHLEGRAKRLGFALSFRHLAEVLDERLEGGQS